MAIFTLQVKPVSRSSGHSAVAKSAYITRSRLTDENQKRYHRYNSAKMKSDLIFTEIIGADGCTIEENQRSKIWNGAEKAEKRKDARTAKEIMVALPKELTKEENIALTRDIVKKLCARYGCVAEYAIHDEKEGNGNFHAHILITTRQVGADLAFGEKIDLELSNEKIKTKNKTLPDNQKILTTDKQIEQWRESWAELVNEKLKEKNIDHKIDHKKQQNRDLTKSRISKKDYREKKKNKNYTSEKIEKNETITKIKELDMELERKRAEIEKARQHRELIQEFLEMEEREQKELIEKLHRAYIGDYNCLSNPNKTQNFGSRPQGFDVAWSEREANTPHGRYTYYTSKNPRGVEYHHAPLASVVVTNPNSPDAIRLAVMTADKKFGGKFNINNEASKEFRLEVINCIAEDPRLHHVKLENPYDQRKLEEVIGQKIQEKARNPIAEELQRHVAGIAPARTAQERESMTQRIKERQQEPKPRRIEDRLAELLERTGMTERMATHQAEKEKQRERDRIASQAKAKTAQERIAELAERTGATDLLNARKNRDKQREQEQEQERPPLAERKEEKREKPQEIATPPKPRDNGWNRGR